MYPTESSSPARATYVAGNPWTDPATGNRWEWDAAKNRWSPVAATAGINITNLSATAGDLSVTINSDTGTGAVIPAANGLNAGLLLPAEKTKLAGVADGATANTGTVTSVTATSPVVSTGVTTPVISMPAASSTDPGYLTSADWTTFNNKVTEVASADGGRIKVTLETTNPNKIKINLPDDVSLLRSVSAKFFLELAQADLTLVSSAALILTSGSVITATLTSNTNCVITLPVIVAGASFMLYLRQPLSGFVGSASWTGTRPVVWPGGIPPVITPSLGKQDILSFVASQDGTKWFGSYVQNFTY
jgi:hypothetical protein